MVKNVNYNGRDGGDPGSNDGCWPIVLMPVAALVLICAFCWRRK